jgi:hypothetical protein
LLGALHALYTFLDIAKPRRIVPDDPAVITAMQNSKIRLTGGAATMWQGWVGFNFSHSLGAIVFGVSCCIVPACLRVSGLSAWVHFGLAVVSAVYLLLAIRYWFRIPVVGTGIATACLTAAWLLALGAP